MTVENLVLLFLSENCVLYPHNSHSLTVSPEQPKIRPEVLANRNQEHTVPHYEERQQWGATENRISRRLELGLFLRCPILANWQINVIFFFKTLRRLSCKLSDTVRFLHVLSCCPSWYDDHLRPIFTPPTQWDVEFRCVKQCELDRRKSAGVWSSLNNKTYYYYYYYYNRFRTLCPGLPRWVGSRKDKPFWILLKQTWWGGSGISWCKLFALRSRR